MQKKVLFWAAGANAKKIVSCLREDVSIEAFVENDALRWGETFCGAEIIPYKKIYEYEFDYVVITTPSYEEILAQLIELGINKDMIITPFDPERCDRNGWREIFHVGELLYYISNQKMQSMMYTLDNMKYEIAIDIKSNDLVFPIIKSVDETLQMVKDGYSMSRYGDGELNMILGRNFSTFQKSDEILISRLKEILKSSEPKHIVCLPDIYGNFDNKNKEHKEWFRRHLANGGREADYKLFDLQKVYYNAFITRPYKDYVDKSGAKERFDALKEIWSNRDITIIEGSKTRFGVGNDLLDNVRSCQRILGPAVNAFDRYEELLEEAKKIVKSRLVLIALGHTATVLAYDLAKEGYQAIDIGHLDIEYEWFLRGTDRKIPIENKFVNEAPLGRCVAEEIDDKKYNREIIAVIK